MAGIRFYFMTLIGASLPIVCPAQVNIQECGYMQRGDTADSGPLTKQEKLLLREQEIEAMANQSEHCASSSGGGGGSGSGSGQQTASRGVGDAPSKPEKPGRASNNHLEAGDSSTGTVAKGTLPSPALSPSAVAGGSQQKQPIHHSGTGVSAPRATNKTADNNKIFKQQLKDKIAAATDPEVKAKLQKRLDAL